MIARLIFMVLFYGLILSGNALAANTKVDDPSLNQDQKIEKLKQGTDKAESSLKMLQTITELKKDINQGIKEKTKALNQSDSEKEKESLTLELKRMDKQLNDYKTDFERIATGIDVGLFAEKKVEKFNWQDEIVSLVEPGIKEIKRLTVRTRYKTRLKDERSYYQDLEPVALEAVDNIKELISGTDDPDLKNKLTALLPEWEGIGRQIRNKTEIVNMQLDEMENGEKSIIETSQTSIKNFFKTRGLFLFIAVMSCIGVILFLRLASRLLVRFIPGYTSTYKPFHVRVLSILSRVIALFMILFVLVFVFYLVEDWVLLSMTIIFILGVGWAAKHTLPQYWHQSRLMLNIGAVREGERITYNGVPWLIKSINVFSELENPSLNVKLRLPIEELLPRTSRAFNKNEPWFPCRQNDWVILADGTRGVVTSLSHEMVELVQRGGSKKTYQTGDFLALSPLNISVNFRLKVPFGISYDLQEKSTTHIPGILESHIAEQIEKEGYKEGLLNLRVEFNQAGGSSLDLIAIADFKGDMAPLYNRLSRAIQRWCVDACTLNNWEIPFPQLTIHK